ncbi:MAG: M56 family metallopeptidase [Gemmatimonadaceae bacterium]
MIASWMLGATVFTGLLGIAALAAERALRTTRFQARLPWAISLGVALVWPVVAPFAVRVLSIAKGPTPIVIDAPVISASTMITRQLPPVSVTSSERLGSALIVLWAIASAILFIRLFVAVRTLSRVQHNARPTVLDGQSVLVTESLGPAVIGLIRPRVAVPSWFMQLDAPLRALVLRHESEHCRSRDPQLVWLAAIAVAAMPWNVGLWWLSRRLRLALEIDCDARTLKRESNHEQYGKLLLLIAQRQSGYPLATMLAESTSHLSRRITAMQMTPLRRPVVRAIIFGSIAVGAVVAACSPRIATDLTGPKALAAASTSKSTTPGATYFEYQVEQPVRTANGSVAPAYPAAQKAAHVGGKVMTQFVVDTHGLPEINTFTVLDSDHTDPAFATAVREALPKMRFEPALVGGRAVKQLVQQPFQFGAMENAVTAGALPSPEDVKQRARMVPDKNMNGTLIPSGTVTKSAPNSSAGVNQGGVTSFPRAARDSANGYMKPGVLPTNPSTDAAVASARSNGQPYFEFQVDRAVISAPGSVGPAYPAALKAAKIEGQVLVQFVVDENGVADVSSFKILRPRAENNEVVHPEFENAIRDALPNMRFVPAQVKGVNVKQVVQQPFQFSLTN